MSTVHRKSAVITGASSGIGRASAARMVRSGWRVFAAVRKWSDADDLQREFGAALVPVLMDLTDRATVASAAQEVASRLQEQGLDGLVNVAGIGMVRPVEYATPRDVQHIFDINVFGQIAVTQALLPLIRRGRGRIVNITSVGAHIPIPFGGLLNASKSAFGTFSDSLRLELHPFGIHVVTLEPGAIRTPAVEKTLGNIDEVTRELPAAGAAQYGEMMETFVARGYTREMNGSSPEVVAQAVEEALTAARPRTRYVVGKHASLLTLLPKILPERLLDALLFRIAGMPRRFGALAADEDASNKRAA